MKSNDQLVKKAEEIRQREHRLRPSLRLKTQSEIVNFVHDMGLVSALGGNELPSLISAVMGKAWRPSSKGFSGWLDWWSLKIEGKQIASISSEIERRDDILATRVFRRTKTFVSDKLWPVLDSIIKHQRELITKGKILSALERKLLETVEAEGPIRTDQLRKRLKLEARENNYKFHRSLTNLEGYALIVGAEDPHPEKHLHANIWQTWEKRTHNLAAHATLSYQESVSRLLEASIEACVVIREDQIRKWFEWSSDTEAAKENLLQSGKFRRADSYLVTSRVLDSPHRHLS